MNPGAVGDLKAAGVLPNRVMIFGQRYAPLGSRFRVGDDAQCDVLLLIDNIFRFIQAGIEVSGLMGQMPSRAISPRWAPNWPGPKSESATEVEPKLARIYSSYKRVLP